MAHIVVGIFNNADEAKNAVDKLVNSGFDRSNIDYAKGSDSAYYTDNENRNNETGIGRFFKDLFDNKDESDRYARVAKDRYVVTVHTEAPGEAHRASGLMDECGAIDVDEKDHEFTAQNKNADDMYSNRPNYNPDEVNERNREYNDVRANRQNEDTYFNDTNKANKESKKIPVIEEDLEIGKKVVETGGVRLYSRIIEKPVEKTIRLREEHVNVERTKVNRAATDEDFNNFKEETVEVREQKEVPVVNKNANVVEEVSVNKTVNERDETVRDKVRRKEVDVENVAANNSKSDR